MSSIAPIDPVRGYCLDVILGSYKRLAPKGRLLSTSAARDERDALLLVWAMSNDLHEIALCAIGGHSGTGQSQSQSLQTTVCYGQISGSIDARETLLQQHLTTDPSVLVVKEAVSSKDSLARRQVLAWALKLARDAIEKSLQCGQGYAKQVLEAHLSVQKIALAMPTIKEAISGSLGHSYPGEAAISYARRNKTGVHSKAADSLRIHEGLRRLAPFALRRIFSDALFDRIGNQRLLELAGGLALAEALSIASGHPLGWNTSIASDGIIAKVGPFAVGWFEELDFDADDGQSTISARDTRTGSSVAFIQCADALGPTSENEVIRLATESLVTACRREAKKGPRFEETPLADCAVVMRRLFAYEPEAPTSARLVITNFDEMTRGRFLELALRACRKANLN